MNTRRFRPTLDSLPSRIAPSGFSSPIQMTAPPATSASSRTTTQETCPTTTCAQPVEPGSFYD